MSKRVTSELASHSVEFQRLLQRGVASLHEEARSLLADFIAGEFDAAHGAFVGRDRQPDLYYSNFGISCAQALQMKGRISLRALLRYFAQQPLPRLDFIHQGCWLAGSAQLLPLCLRWSCFSLRPFKLMFMQYQAKKMLRHGAWYEQPSFLSDPYMIFLAINLMHDLRLPLPPRFCDLALAALDASRAQDGCSYGKSPHQQGGGVTAITVAAILARRQLSGELDEPALAWVQRQQQPVGGFVASVDTPLPDMLSTAVSLFTLHITGCLQAETSRKAKQFLSDHWLPNGGFASLIDEEKSDCEYTFYGLLSLGAIAA